MTKKLTPDPPPAHDAANDFAPCELEPLTFTRAKPVSSESPGKPSLFAIQQGVNAHEALAHVSRLLESAQLNGDELSLHTDPFERALFWSMLHSVEMARAVVDALLDGAPATDLNTPNS
ncbi:hypothetical protein SAMN05216598_4650 [Pseudomonas asplenii]|uniref:DUF3077 family protein n=1 Tax=Pseudomonas asplenii TaxID=53407 RepID=A0A1H1YVJ2_9PSED|nr:hypothetical protein [Pseudomonas asplenii]SDT25357.1 hypothetical protein SAMN05216598_4650 [Pseudomonas asplenii]